MTQDTTIKTYPTTTSEVAQMLGIHGTGQNLPLGSMVPPTAPVPVRNLPVADLPADDFMFDGTNSSVDPGVNGLKSSPEAPAGSHTDPAPALPGSAADSAHFAFKSGEAKVDDAAAQPQSPVFVKAAKAVGPYVVVFGVGLFLYYFFFSSVNFSGIFKSTPKAATPKQTAVQTLESQNLVSYQTWISGYYYDVTDPKLLDPEADNSGNGLSNFQKYLLNLNPKSYDSLGLGMADSQALAMGTNPLTGASLTTAQKDILAKYVDMEVVMNRLALNRLQHPSAVAGIGVNANGTVFNPTPSGNTGGPQPLHVRGSNPEPVLPLAGGPVSFVGANPASTSSNGSGSNDSGVDVNTDIPGRLEIPDLKVNVPIIWSKDPKNFDTDLQVGVVHYPGTAVPGQIGTTYISGHSSNYIWAKGNYNHVFTHLGDLADNTSFKITAVQKNGKDAIFHYVVTHRKEYAPTDQEQFANSGKSTVALSTCWPVGSTAKRLVVFGELTQVEK